MPRPVTQYPSPEFVLPEGTTPLVSALFAGSLMNRMPGFGRARSSVPSPYVGTTGTYVSSMGGGRSAWRGGMR